ncbi:Alpha/Beta hydrolase protein [Ilyonectria robusta]|uniref:Alpha/Beta hydrolase protein n=1 Tax=Ilyonectria robusta TaxID=1079257 RepID=UPI001E8E94EB|nr:Alpha/Beta hydrolase protein [Ilyonectria robusta]KAH8738472.1 Alpha/Beta hydrolase protein [Ilyonectria robusta]
MTMRSLFLSFAWIAMDVACASAVRCNNLTTVDLGYAVHQGVCNTAFEYYSFNNIRYAEAPVGELRWSKPIPPKTTNRTLNDGTDQRVCPQSYPRWILESRAAAAGITVEKMAERVMSNPRMNEDCLLLDVHVPAKVFNKRYAVTSGSAVLVWIHGGGYDIDSKQYDPSGLISRSQLNDQEGIIFVALNYRLGMFGFLDGNRDDILSNAGLWDQRMALEWVQKHVHLFGGDPDRVTVIGESAGGGSVMHQVTAFGGRGEVPFAAAIAQSPAFWTITNDLKLWETTLAVASQLSSVEITTAEQLRLLNSSTLMQVNQAMTYNAPYGLFVYGPTVDGTFVPDIPSVLLLNGQFYDSIKGGLNNMDTVIMVGHNRDEASTFTASLDTNEQLISMFQLSYPVSDTAERYIFTDLYPNILNGTYGYTSQLGRAKLLISELVFTCNTRFLGTAFRNQTYNYRFECPPGLHGQDLDWTFFVEEDPDVAPEIAIAMQSYFTTFTMTGDPNGNAGLPTWPLYGEEATLVIFGAGGVATAKDETANRRCEYWQKGEYRKSG